jgi:hypothetical protein
VISSADYEKLSRRLADRDFNVKPRPYAPKVHSLALAEQLVAC